MSGPNDRVSSDAPSRKYRQYTLDGASDINLQTDGNGPCRGIMLLSTATGSMTTTPANPILGDEPTLVTNLPAGTVLPKVATAIKGGLPAGLVVDVYW